MVDRELKTAAIFMKQQGFLHFDAHFHNILTDGYHLYLADFGLAISQEFELSPDERSFFEKHRDYDRYYVVTRLFEAVIIADLEIEKHQAFFEGRIPPEDLLSKLPHAVAAIIRPYVPIAVLMQRFFQELRTNKNTPYPEAELVLEWEKLGI